MKASKFVLQIMQDIQDNGEDFELAGVYWTEMEVKELLGNPSKEQILNLLEDIEDAAEEAGGFIIVEEGIVWN